METDVSDVERGGPLAGVTVVDLTSTFMGPFCTLVLAQFGARVIKVEPPAGDITRGIGDVEATGLGPIFMNANVGKESIVLNLREEDDYERLLALVAEADVVTHNRPPGSEKRLGIDYETLRGVNPRVIVCAMHGYGSAGPYGSEPAYDDVIQAVSGVAACQTGDGPPQYVRSPIADKVTGMMASSAISAALVERAISGAGQAIEVPMFETMVQFLLLEQQGGYVFDPPRGATGYSRLDSLHRRPFRTKDGLVGVVPNTDAHWMALFEVFSAQERTADPRFSTIRSRTEHIDELYEWLAEELSVHTTDEALELLRKVNVPVKPVTTVAGLFRDPHLQAVDFLAKREHPVLGGVRQARPPVNFSRSGAGTYAPAPLLDADGPRLRAHLDSRRSPNWTPGSK